MEPTTPRGINRPSQYIRGGGTSVAQTESEVTHLPTSNQIPHQ